MILPIPGPGTHPHDWMPDAPVCELTYEPHAMRRKAKPRGGKTGHPINGTHPRAAYWREYKRRRTAARVRSTIAEKQNP